VILRSALLKAVLVLTMLCPLVGGRVCAAELAADVQRDLRRATFEVVQLKPAEGAVTYEHPLPMDLMPYQQRNDKYRSIGTAFAIAANRYVTARHVIMVGLDSQFGPPALRDETGKVYEIDQVLRFSDREDFVVFSLREQPKDVQYLKAGSKPALNQTVFSVGNALGQGVVIRDGIYTSDTPEEQDGQWSWLRFTAAASPGNSGGPLVDQRGRVIGVVLRKSPSENLNYALSITQVLNAKEGEGKVGSRTAVRLPIIDASETLVTDERIALPKPLAQFYSMYLEVMTGAMQRGTTQLLAHNAARLFPHGAGSERLLHVVEHAMFPVRLHEAQNGIWVMGAANARTVQLEHNGFVQLDGGTLRLRAPDGASLPALYGDSKLVMDLFLNAYPLRRAVGTDSVRVTSLGKATKEGTYTDAYGRLWQVRAWAIPYEDAMLTVISLPTPEGSAGFFFKASAAVTELVNPQEQLLLDYVYVTMEGTLAQWQAYLEQKSVQPKVFETLKLEIDPERRVRFQSRRCELVVTPTLLKLSKDSVLRMNFAFFRDGETTVWDVGGVAMRESGQTQNWINVWRKSEPSSGSPENLQSDWNKAKAHEFPYNATISNESGETRISTSMVAAGAGDAAKIRYGLRVIAEGTQPQEAMSRKLDLLQHAFKVLEQ
jgi:serine protease Do